MAATATTSAPATQETQVYKTFADFNSVTFQARIQHVELKTGPKGEFAAITAITNLKNGEDGVALRFIATGSELALTKTGALMPGRRVHVTGTICGFANAYTNAEGVVVPLARPRLQLMGISLKLGAKPRTAMSNG